MADKELGLRDLRILAILLRERNLTRTAYALSTTQPSISKALGRLRTHFHDPLFVYSRGHMEPTPKALQLTEPVSSLLEMSAALQRRDEAFEPSSSRRDFRLLLTDVGMMFFVPTLLQRMETIAPGINLVAVPMDSRQLERKLESGEADIALGAFPQAPRSLRRQKLFLEPYVSVARKSHPRLSQLRTRSIFIAERHVVVSRSQSGHGAHDMLAEVLESELNPAQIGLRVPSFGAVAVVAMKTNIIGTLPWHLATSIGGELGLSAFKPPIEIPKIEIAQFWHERYHRDPGHRWLRELIKAEFKQDHTSP
jgi:DNA-binding transcriptional LysR family regulator